MSQQPFENRSQNRFDTSVNVQFSFKYEIDAEVQYQKLDENIKEESSRKYKGKSKNISSKGLCVLTEAPLSKGDKLLIEILVPGLTPDFILEGEVRWSSENDHKDDSDLCYKSGIEINTIKGQSVNETIYYDETYHVYWSVFLESVLGNYRKFVQARKN